MRSRMPISYHSLPSSVNSRCASVALPAQGIGVHRAAQPVGKRPAGVVVVEHPHDGETQAGEEGAALEGDVQEFQSLVARDGVVEGPALPGHRRREDDRRRGDRQQPEQCATQAGRGNHERSSRVRSTRRVVRSTQAQNSGGAIVGGVKRHVDDPRRVEALAFGR